MIFGYNCSHWSLRLIMSVMTLSMSCYTWDIKACSKRAKNLEPIPLAQAAQLPGLLWQPWHHQQHPGCHSGDPHCLLTQSWAECQSSHLQHQVMSVSMLCRATSMPAGTRQRLSSQPVIAAHVQIKHLWRNPKP